MNSTTLTLSLLEFLAWRAGCQYLSDLHFLDGWQRTLLARAVREIQYTFDGVVYRERRMKICL